MHPPILSRYMFNILYNVMIRLINYERFSTNNEKYLKLVDGMRGQPSKSPTTPPCLPPQPSKISFFVGHTMAPTTMY